MMSRLKNLMETSERLNELNEKVSDSASVVLNQSKEVEGFKGEVRELKLEVQTFTSEASRFSETAFSQLAGIKKTNESLKTELYDFKLIKSEIKSRLVGEVMDELRAELRKETGKLDTDVKCFNELKDELSVLVGKFKSVESEITKFKSIASQVNSADFELGKFARELEKSDSEKLRLMQENDNLKRLLAKERRGRR
ncbi:MAG: hypothetical protein ACTSWQ_08375 [Candidatus Thorarchaeota archaeon]